MRHVVRLRPQRDLSVREKRVDLRPVSGDRRPLGGRSSVHAHGCRPPAATASPSGSRAVYGKSAYSTAPRCSPTRRASRWSTCRPTPRGANTAAPRARSATSAVTRSSSSRSPRETRPRSMSIAERRVAVVELGQHPADPTQQPRRVTSATEQRVRVPEMHISDTQAVEHLHVLAATSVEQRRGVIGTALSQERPGRSGVRRGAGGREQRHHRHRGAGHHRPHERSARQDGVVEMRRDEHRGPPVVQYARDPLGHRPVRHGHDCDRPTAGPASDATAGRGGRLPGRPVRAITSTAAVRYISACWPARTSQS